MKTSELTGVALDWAVAKCEGVEFELDDGAMVIGTRYEANSADDNYGCEFDETYNPSTDWQQGGPIIEREKIKLGWVVDHWVAQKDFNYNKSFYGRDPHHPLIAAMRCYVASKLGDEVEIPNELTQGESK